MTRLALHGAERPQESLVARLADIKGLGFIGRLAYQRNEDLEKQAQLAELIQQAAEKVLADLADKGVAYRIHDRATGTLLSEQHEAWFVSPQRRAIVEKRPTGVETVLKDSGIRPELSITIQSSARNDDTAILYLRHDDDMQPGEYSYSWGNGGDPKPDEQIAFLQATLRAEVDDHMTEYCYNSEREFNPEGRIFGGQDQKEWVIYTGWTRDLPLQLPEGAIDLEPQAI